MRSGFSVCANACKCHALLPKILRFSTTFNCRFATLFNFETFAEYCQVSPARTGAPASTGATDFFTSVGIGDAELEGSGCGEETAGGGPAFAGCSTAGTGDVITVEARE